jgi:imidazolonepropionase-like amidohydrolase
MTKTLITGAQVFDGTGKACFRADVLIDGNRIAAVFAGPAGPETQGATVIDGARCTLMPGLIEPHSHLSFPNTFAKDLTAIPREENMLATARNAALAIDSGYTSMLSMASAKPRLDIALKREIEAGLIPGPRYLACSTELTVTGGLGDSNQLHLPYNGETVFSTIVNGEEEMRKACRTFAREGVDIFKLHLSGDLGTTSAAAPEQMPMTDAEVKAAVDVAKATGRRVAAHARSAESVLMALRHDIMLLNHANYVDERALDALEAAKETVFVIPAAGLDYKVAHANGQWGVSSQRSDSFRRELEATVVSVGHMRKRGIRVLPGGDYGFPYTPHGSYAFDLWLFVEVFGFTAAETLAAATGIGGDIMGRKGELGLIKPGALADLLLVDGDPTRDVGILQEAARLRLIMKDGVVHKSRIPAHA